MGGGTIEKADLTKAALILFEEAYLGPLDPKAGTWFTDNEPGSGFLGSVEALSAQEASRPLHPTEPLSVASHVEHLRFALDLANRSTRGENPYATARWARSWDTRTVSETEWKDLVAALRKEFEDYKAAIATGKAWGSQDSLTGTLGLIAHGAWHLGAIRQALGLVKAPTT